MAKCVRSASKPWWRWISAPSFSASAIDKRVVAPAPVTGEMDVPRLVRPVVLRAGLEVGVLQDADLLQERERPVDGRGVDAGHLALHLPGDRGGGDMAGRPHHLGDDGTALGRHAEAAPPQELHHVGEFDGSLCHGRGL